MTKAKKVAKGAAKAAKKSSRTTPPFTAYPEWTEAKFWAFVRSGLRSTFSRWPPKYKAKAAARRAYEGPNKRQKSEYQCAICKKWFPDKETEMDHIIPCGSLKGFNELPGFVERLACGEGGYRCLCKGCHKRRTQEERDNRG